MQFKPNSIFEAASSVLTEAVKKPFNHLTYNHDTLAAQDVKIEFAADSVTYTYTVKGQKKKVVWPLNKAYEYSENPVTNFIRLLRKEVDASVGITKKSYGLTKVTETPKEISIFTNGNMTTTLASVNKDLAQLGYDSIDKLKKQYPKHKETGSPSYSYSLVLKK